MKVQPKLPITLAPDPKEIVIQDDIVPGRSQADTGSGKRG